MNTTETIDNLVKFVLFKLKEKNIPVSHFLMQKTIFMLKMRLGSDHELYNKIPYYWYIHGPYSSVVAESFKSVENDCIKQGNMLILRDDVFNSINIKNNPISRIYLINDEIDEIISDESKFQKIDEEIYKEYSPYRFMHSYKYNVFNVVEKTNDIDDIDIDKLIFHILDCEGDLPFDNKLLDFSICYSMFMTPLEVVNEKNKIKEFWEDISFILIELWNTFASGMRLKFHDKDYDFNLETWESDYENRKNNIKDIIADFTDDAFSLIKEEPEDYEKGSFEDRIIQATFGNYLKD